MVQLIKIAGYTTEPSGHIIFVHGLGGHAYETWQANENEETFWPQWLAADTPNITIWSVSYEASPSKWSGTSLPLIDRAATVLESIRTEPQINGAPIIFICHSLGGLIAKQVLSAANNDQRHDIRSKALINNTKAVVFLATPHNGAGHASLLQKCRFFAWPSEASKDLVLNNPTLRFLNKWYRNWSEEKGIQHYVFWETLNTAGALIVDPGSADPGLLHATVLGVDADHGRICKPEDSSMQVYRSTLDFVQQIIGPQEQIGTLLPVERHKIKKVPYSNKVAKIARVLLLAILIGVPSYLIWQPYVDGKIVQIAQMITHWFANDDVVPIEWTELDINTVVVNQSRSAIVLLKGSTFSEAIQTDVSLDSGVQYPSDSEIVQFEKAKIDDKMIIKFIFRGETHYIDATHLDLRARPS